MKYLLIAIKAILRERILIFETYWCNFLLYTEHAFFGMKISLLGVNGKSICGCITFDHVQ